MDTSRIETMLGRTIWMLLEVKRVANCPLLVGKVLLGFPSTFTKTQASSPFESLNSTHLSKCQSDVRPPIQKRGRFRASSGVSTGDSNTPSFWEMKNEPAFKTLQENPDFFCVRVSRGPFHLRQKTQSPSHIPISEGRLLLRCL